MLSFRLIIQQWLAVTISLLQALSPPGIISSLCHVTITPALLTLLVKKQHCCQLLQKFNLFRLMQRTCCSHSASPLGKFTLPNLEIHIVYISQESNVRKEKSSLMLPYIKPACPNYSIKGLVPAVFCCKQRAHMIRSINYLKTEIS